MTRPTPLEICHKEPNRAVNAPQSVFLKPHTLIPLGRHIKHIDQEPYCRSVQFSCKERPIRAGRFYGRSNDDRPKTRLRDGVDGYLQVIIKEPTAEDVQKGKADNPEKGILLDLYFLDSTRQSRDRNTTGQSRDCGKVAIKKLDQCLKINNSTLGAVDPPRKRLDGEFAGRLSQKRPLMVVRDQKLERGHHKRKQAMPKSAVLDLGRGEGVTGVGIGPKKELSPEELRFPNLANRSNTYLGPAVTPATPALSSSSSLSAAAMKARAKRQHDVLWLSGTKPNYLLGEESTPPPRLLDSQSKKQTPGTAKSEPLPTTNSGLTPSPTVLDRTKSSITRFRRHRYLESDFGFNREALRENLGMTQRTSLPRDSSSLEKRMGNIAEKHIYSFQNPSQYHRSSRVRQSVDGLRRTIYPGRDHRVISSVPHSSTTLPGRSEKHRGLGLTPRAPPSLGHRGKQFGSQTELDTLSSLPPIDGLNMPICGQCREPTVTTLA